MKYILFGLLASALLLYGISLMYGFAGTLSLQDPNFLAWFAKAPMPIIALSIGLIMAGFLFKIAAAPFHFYAPDVYQGTSATTLILLSVAPKIAGYALFANFLGFFSFKIFNQILFWPMYNWETFLSVIAIMTLIIGSFVALSQTNIKRLMAYAGIAQSGFLLMGLIGYTSIGVVALLFYLLAYLLMNAAAFMLISYFEQQHEAYDLADYKGLVRKSPLASIFIGSCFCILYWFATACWLYRKIFIVFSELPGLCRFFQSSYFNYHLYCGNCFYRFFVLLFYYYSKHVYARSYLG